MRHIAFLLVVSGLAGIAHPASAFEKPVSGDLPGHRLFHTVAACNPNEDSPKGKAAEACRDAYLQCTGSYHSKQDDCINARSACEAKIGC